MTETNDTDTDPNNASKGEQPATERPSPSTPKSKAKAKPGPAAGPSRRRPVRRTLLTLVWLLVVGLAAAAGYASWYVWQHVQQQNEKLAQMEAAVGDQSQGLEQHSRTLEEQSRTLEEQSRTLEEQARRLEQMPRNLEQELTRSQREQSGTRSELLENMEQRLNRVDRRLGAIAGTNREDWKLAEAEYLLRLANQRLVLERDSHNALALAQTADDILRDLGDSELLPVRRALARDIQALKLAGQVDREGLYLQLLALGEQIPGLPLVEPLSDPESALGAAAEGGAPAEAGGGTWERIKQSFTRVLERLSSHIRIRHHDEPITALADPREQFYLRQQLQLMLEQAQAALLREETDIFRTSLTRAAQWLEQYYHLNPQTRAVRATLTELAATDIAPELPDLNEALSLLESHIEQLHRLSPDFQRAPGEDLGEESDS